MLSFEEFVISTERKDPETLEGLKDRLAYIKKEISSFHKQGKLTEGEREQVDHLEDELKRLEREMGTRWKEHPTLLKKVEELENKIKRFKKYGKIGGGVAAVGGLAYGGYKLFHRKKDTSTEGMLSFNEFAYALEEAEGVSEDDVLKDEEDNMKLRGAGKLITTDKKDLHKDISDYVHADLAPKAKVLEPKGRLPEKVLKVIER